MYKKTRIIWKNIYTQVVQKELNESFEALLEFNVRTTELVARLKTSEDEELR